MKDTYCAAAFNHIYSNSAGVYSLCCHASTNTSELNDFKTKDYTPFEFFKSDKMEDIRNRMLENKPIG